MIGREDTGTDPLGICRGEFAAKRLWVSLVKHRHAHSHVRERLGRAQGAGHISTGRNQSGLVSIIGDDRMSAENNLLTELVHRGVVC